MESTYQFILEGIIPATREAYKPEGFDATTKNTESTSLIEFKKVVEMQILKNKPSKLFPTEKPVFVAIIQFFISNKKDYSRRDVDNMAKTVLDVLGNNKLFVDDSQVRTLVVSKRIDIKCVPQDLCFIHAEILEDGQDMPVVNDLVVEALHMYQVFKSNL